jgi:hypothetical protein
VISSDFTDIRSLHHVLPSWELGWEKHDTRDVPIGEALQCAMPDLFVFMIGVHRRNH